MKFYYYWLNPFKGIFLIYKIGMGLYLFLPMILTLLFSLSLSIGIYYLMQYLFFHYFNDFFSNIPFLLSIMSILLIVQSLFLFIVFYRLISQILILPFLEPLRKRLENHFHIQENRNPPTLKQELQNLLWSIYQSFIFIFLYIFVFILTLFLAPIQPMILFFIDSYILGNGIYDSFLEKYFPSPRERKQELKKRKLEFFLTGISSTLILLIPIIGVLLSAICGYIGAFLNYHQIKSIR